MYLNKGKHFRRQFLLSYQLIRCIMKSLIATSTYFLLKYNWKKKKKKKLEKFFLGTRAWAPKLVHWSPKQPGYVPVIMRSGNYGRKENGSESKEKYLEAKKKKIGGLLTRPNVKHNGKDWEMLYSKMIKNMMCLRLQRGCSKPIRILLVSSA